MFVLLLLLLICAAAVCLYTENRFTGWLAFLVNRDTHVVLFAALMSLLPIIGFPIIIFLVLAGVKFGLIERNFPVVLLLLVILSGGYFLLLRLQKKGLIPAWTKSSEKSEN